MILTLQAQTSGAPILWNLLKLPIGRLRAVIALNDNDVSHSTALTDFNCLGVLG
jgi:hypothetical protein